MRRKSPVTVQQWIDSLPVVVKSNNQSVNINTYRTECNSGCSVSNARYGVRGLLMRDASIQSDDASNCSSVESVLELRRPDPEAVLLGLGFGPPKSTDFLTRIPTRFLQQSRTNNREALTRFLKDFVNISEMVNGIDIGKFLQDYEQQRILDNQLSHPFTNCSQIHSSPVSPSRNCDNSVTNVTKKNSF